MKIRNLVLLVVVAGILAAWAVWTMRPRPKAAVALIGAKVLPGLPINRVNKIVLTGATNTLTLAKVKGTWSVASRFDYPANFDKIADSLLLLSDIKIGQVMTSGESQKAAFHLLDPAAMTTGSTEQAATRMELRDENEGLIAALLIGKQFIRAAPEGGMQGPLSFGDYPDGQYVQTSDGRILLVGQTLDRLSDNAKYWLVDEFINVPAAEIRKITINAPASEPIELVSSKSGEPFALSGLKAEEGTLDTAKAGQIGGVLNFLGFEDVANPALSPKETGLDHPIVFESRTEHGRIYTLRIGNALTNDTLDRYIQASVDWKAPEEPPAADKSDVPANAGPDDKAQAPEESAKTDPQETDKSAKDSAEAKAKANRQMAADAKALNERLSKWTYIVKSYRAEPFLFKRVDLIKKPEPPAKPDDGLPAVAPGAKAGRQKPDAK